MAATLTKAQILRVVAARGYSTQAIPIAGTSNYEIQTTVLPNKLVVASADNDSPIARVSILFRAGSRNETSDNLGSTHVLRLAAGSSTRSCSQFAISRQLQQVGANLSCSTDREIVAYTLEGTRKVVEETVCILSSVATEQVFKPWEISAHTSRLRLELATRPPQQRAVDLLHKAAYRQGLGNSLYIAKYNIEKISSETLQHYVASTFKANRAAVVGLGVDHGELVKYAQGLELDSGDDNTGPGKYKGGEIRSDKGGDLAYVAIACEGAALRNPKETLAFAVLQRAFGTGPSTKRGLGTCGVLRRAVGSLDEPHSIAAINVNYSDSGLFGVITAAKFQVAGDLVSAAVKALKSGNINDDDIRRGKSQLKTDVLLNLESGGAVLEKLGVQAVLLGSVQSPAEIVAAIDKIAPADVKAAAKKVSGQKLTIAAVGNLTCVPFLDELK